MLLHRADRLPSGEGWAFEPKWDGFRCLAELDGDTRLVSRRGTDLTPRLPELGRLHHDAPTSVVLDAELVALRSGVPSFDALRLRVLGRRRDPGVSVVLVAFDLLVLGDRPVTALPYDRRRRILEGLGIEGPGIQVTLSCPASEGPALFAATKEQGMEGVVAKRIQSPYRPGVRSRDWIKVKHFTTEAFGVGGWLPDEGGGVGALLLGRRVEGKLAYAGAVEFGFDRSALHEALQSLAAPGPVLRGGPRRARPVRPEITVRVRYQSLHSDGRVRAATVVGLGGPRPRPAR